MSYALIVDGMVASYPYSFGKLRADNPDVSFPRDPSDERLAEWGVVAVAPAERPVADITQNVVEGAPVLVGEVWTQVWNVVDASAEEIAARQKLAAAAAAKSDVKADAFVASFVAMTPVEVDAYIEANVTNLASAKAVLGKLALMVLILARQEFRE